MAKPGPKTQAGKKIVSLNAVKHGVLSTTPVIPGIEREEDWEAHRAGVLESLHPEGHLETILTERIATLLWRLQRVVLFETESISLAQERAEEDLTKERENLPIASLDPNEQVLAARGSLALLQALSGLPDDRQVSSDAALVILDAVASETEDLYVEDMSLPRAPGEPLPDGSTDWSVGEIRKGIASMAAKTGMNPDALLSAAVKTAREDVSSSEKGAERLVTELGRMRRERLMPLGPELDKIMRYEAHLNRQLNQTLHELEALQVRRQGGVAPLARLDVQGLPEN